MTLHRGTASRQNTSDLVAAASYYARTPALLLDSNGVIGDINVACRELLGLRVAGCKGRHFRYLEERLRPDGEASLFPPDGLASTRFRGTGDDATDPRPVLDTEEIRAAIAERALRTDRFGEVRLRVTELPCLHSDTGSCAGSLLNLEVLAMDDPEAFRQAVDLRLRHEIMWEVYAASYDSILPELFFYKEVVERHCATLSPDHIRSIVDLGSGTGNVAVPLLKLGKRVVSVDISRAMLERLGKKVGDRYPGRLTIIADTAEDLSYLQDASFDAVNVLLAFFDMDDPALALKEAVRVLRPGGILVTTEPRSCFNVAQLMAVAEESLRDKGLLDRLANDWRRIQAVAPFVRDAVQHSQGPNSMVSLSIVWHAEAIYDFLSRGGFGDLTFQESHLGNCATIIGTKPS